MMACHAIDTDSNSVLGVIFIFLLRAEQILASDDHERRTPRDLLERLVSLVIITKRSCPAVGVMEMVI